MKLKNYLLGIILFILSSFILLQQIKIEELDAAIKGLEYEMETRCHVMEFKIKDLKREFKNSFEFNK